MTPSTPKTFVLPAGAAPVAAVLYRKSHLTTYVLQLDYSKRQNGYKDRLTKGSRFYGRFFPERCDISPDGKLMIYFVMRGRKTGESSDPSTWTAVCSPPWLKAHLFCPNGSTWGGGGQFLRNHRLIVFDNPDDPSVSAVRGYKLIKDTKTLSAAELDDVKRRFRPPKMEEFPCPTMAKQKKGPVILRHHKKDVASGFDMFDYELRDADGEEMAGADDLILANWAGWDMHGRLLAAMGRQIRIYEVEPRKPLPKPVKILDLETAIAGTA